MATQAALSSIQLERDVGERAAACLGGGCAEWMDGGRRNNGPRRGYVAPRTDVASPALGMLVPVFGT